MHIKLLIKETFFSLPLYQIVLPLKNHFMKYAFLFIALIIRKLCLMICIEEMFY